MKAIKRGEIWLADLNPIRGSEQAGVRPIIIFQNDLLNSFTSTILAIPLTTNLRRATLPSCILIPLEEGGGLKNDSVALCHQLRVLDKTRLQHRLGTIGQQTLSLLENKVLFTMGII